MGITREELSRIIRMSISSIYFIETKVHIPSFESILKLSSVLEIDLSKFCLGVLVNAEAPVEKVKSRRVKRETIAL